jgi:hypothetical protein
LTRRKTDIAVGAPPSQDEVVAELGHHFASALGGKRAWLASELLRLKREDSEKVLHEQPNGMEVDQAR